MNVVKYLVIFFLATTLLSCKVWHISQSQVVNEEMDSTYDSGSSDQVTELIKPFKDSLSASMGEILGKVEGELKKARPEGTLGNWVADALQYSATKLYPEPIAFALQNYGGIRVPYLPKGEITVSNIYELMPFDNTILIVKATGVQLKKYFDIWASEGSHPISKGISYEMRDNKAYNILIHQKPIQEDAMYNFALPDYVFNVSKHHFTKIESHNTGYLARDAFIEYAKYQQEKFGKISAKLEGRITKKD